MELLETQDPEKKRLIESSERHKKALEKEVSDLSKKSEKMLTNALIIGGSLALTYVAIRSFSGHKKRKKKKDKLKNPSAETAVTTEEQENENTTPSLISQVGTQILNQATLLLINIAKDKLAEYLQSRKKPDENS